MNKIIIESDDDEQLLEELKRLKFMLENERDIALREKEVKSVYSMKDIELIMWFRRARGYEVS